MPTNVLQRLLVAPLPYVPRSLVWRMSQRYVAGVDFDSARQTVTELNRLGCSATMDVLGEDSTTTAEVDAARNLYLEALDGIHLHKLQCNVSVKLSDMGLRLDGKVCLDAMRAIVAKAADLGNFVRIDMEDSSVTSATLDIYRKLRERHDNVGAVIQSCLRRSQRDVQALMDDGLAHLRLCKGIYVEGEDVAFTSAGDIRRSYSELLEQMLQGGATKVGIATHDPKLVEHATQTISRLQVDKSRYEFQMLLGVAGTLRAALVARGHPLRVYVPFGERWYAYSMRRMRENPGIALHIIRNLFSRA